MEWVLQPGDHFVFEWLEGDGRLLGGFYHSAAALVISEGSCQARMWNSEGEELSMIG